MPSPAYVHDPQDIRRLPARTLAAIERDAADYEQELRQPRRLVRRLLDHIAYLTEQLNPGKD